MPRELRIVVEGPPVPKARPRVDRRSGRIYTPRSTSGYETRVRVEAMAACAELARPWPTDAEYRVELLVYLPNLRTRDIDNVAKACLDACNRLLWRDDGQVRRLELERRLDRDEPRVEMTVEVLDAA